LRCNVVVGLKTINLDRKTAVVDTPWEAYGFTMCSHPGAYHGSQVSDRSVRIMPVCSN
jgi:hypothetical protein